MSFLLASSAGSRHPPKIGHGDKHMRRFIGLGMTKRVTAAGLALCAAVTTVTAAEPAQAQEIQLTGPLAGAKAVRKLRLHRDGRFEISPGATFTLLDEYQRTIMPGLRIGYHFTDWFGVHVWGGYGIQVPTSLTNELQTKAIDDRRCDANPTSSACKLTAVNLTRPGSNRDGSVRAGTLTGDQLGAFQWVVAPQLTFVPFRGKLALFSALFTDVDLAIFLGPAIVGLKQRAPCGVQDDGSQLDPCSQSFSLKDSVTVAPTFGLQLTFFPTDFFGFGADFRAMPFQWSTSGFDVKGGGASDQFPDNNFSGADSDFKFNTMTTVFLSFNLPTKPKLSD